VTGVCSEHGEGPVWRAGRPGLRWADMLAGDLLTPGPDGG
jgi:sugar lactone lactonase YvrE